MTWTALSSGPSPATGASAKASTSSPVRLVPESLRRSVSWSWSSCAKARSGSSAGRTSGASSGSSRFSRPDSDSPSDCSNAVVPKSTVWWLSRSPGSGANSGSSDRCMVGKSSWETSGMPLSSGKTSRAVWPSGAGTPVVSWVPVRPRSSSGNSASFWAEWTAPRLLVPGSVMSPPYPPTPLSCGSDLTACPAGPPGSGLRMAITEELRRWARSQQRRYAHGEPRPLGGLLGAMGVYAAVVAAGAAAVRVSGRRLPDRIPLGDAVLLTVATFRTARTIAKDPVTSPLRAPFTRYEGTSGEAEVAEEIREHGGVKHAIGELVTCPFCLAQWVATALAFSYVAAPRATRMAALTMTAVAGADVLQFVYDAIQNGALEGDDGGE